MKLLAAGERWLSSLSEERFFFGLLTLCTTCIGALLIFFALYLHGNFLTIACDTAAFQSAIVNTLHGNWFRDTAYDGPNLLGLHTMFVLLLIAPVYSFLPSVNTLFVLQICGVYSSIIPLYLVARQILDRPQLAFVAAATALASPMLLHMALAPVNPETWILAALLWSIYFLGAGRLNAFWISFAFAVCCGEKAALVYIALGLTLWTLPRTDARRRLGPIIMAAGVAWSLLAVAIVFPLMRQPAQHNLFVYNYANWNVQQASALPLAMASDPLKAIGFLLSPYRWLHLASLIGLPLLLILFSWRSALLLIPFPFYFLMSDQEFYLYFHVYYFQFAFLAGYLAFFYFLTHWNLSTRLGMAVVAVTFLINLLNLCAALGLYMALAAGSEGDFSREIHEAFDRIPPEAAVYCPHRYSAYLSNRTNMVMGDLRDENLDFNAMIEGKYPVTNVHASQIDYLVCDVINDQCGWRQGGFDPAVAKRRAANLQRLVQSGRWQVFWAENDLVILSAKGK